MSQSSGAVCTTIVETAARPSLLRALSSLAIPFLPAQLRDPTFAASQRGSMRRETPPGVNRADVLCVTSIAGPHGAAQLYWR